MKKQVRLFFRPFNENAYYILTPSEEASLDKISRYSELVSSIGALPMILTAQEHDYITCGNQSLASVVASSLGQSGSKTGSSDESHGKVLQPEV